MRRYSWREQETAVGLTGRLLRSPNPKPKISSNENLGWDHTTKSNLQKRNSWKHCFKTVPNYTVTWSMGDSITRYDYAWKKWV